jgi:hypothetical protein
LAFRISEGGRAEGAQVASARATSYQCAGLINGKTCHQKVGRTIDLALADARKQARSLRAEIALGANLRGQAKAQTEVLTFAEFFAACYLLLEFQSRVDRYMALRMMVYVGLLYQDLIKRGEVLADGRLPPVLPIVLYNGSQRWTASSDVFDLIPPVPGLVEQFKPRLKYLLIDENAYTDGELASLNNLVAAVFRIEHPASPAAIGVLLALLDEWLVDRPDLRRMFALWIRATLMRKAEYRIVLPRMDDLQELNVMLAERLEEWAHAYKAEG